MTWLAFGGGVAVGAVIGAAALFCYFFGLFMQELRGRS